LGHLPFRGREGTGEGLFDCRHDTVDILKNVIVPESKDAVAAIGQECVSPFVGRTLRMLPAVHFNDEFDGPAHEIANVRADGDLAVEPNAAELPIAD
jgi:hypothetical protein